VDNIFSNISAFSQTLKAAAPQLESLVAHIDQIADTLAKANIAHVIRSLDSTINNIEVVIAKVNQGEGTVGQLMQNKTLYNNIITTTEDLNALLKDLKANPGRYVHISVFGKKEKKEKK
jgi:phospholipid/cholesterol/gamma-HCH transport system substrate-binding protein